MPKYQFEAMPKYQLKLCQNTSWSYAKIPV